VYISLGSDEDVPVVAPKAKAVSARSQSSSEDGGSTDDDDDNVGGDDDDDDDDGDVDSTGM
jgi:hypothetical protein